MPTEPTTTSTAQEEGNFIKTKDDLWRRFKESVSVKSFFNSITPQFNEWGSMFFKERDPKDRWLNVAKTGISAFAEFVVRPLQLVANTTWFVGGQFFRGVGDVLGGTKDALIAGYDAYQTVKNNRSPVDSWLGGYGKYGRIALIATTNFFTGIGRALVGAIRCTAVIFGTGTMIASSPISIPGTAAAIAITSAISHTAVAASAMIPNVVGIMAASPLLSAAAGAVLAGATKSMTTELLEPPTKDEIITKIKSINESLGKIGETQKSKDLSRSLEATKKEFRESPLIPQKQALISPTAIDPAVFPKVAADVKAGYQSTLTQTGSTLTLSGGNAAKAAGEVPQLENRQWVAVFSATATHAEISTYLENAKTHGANITGVKRGDNGSEEKLVDGKLPHQDATNVNTNTINLAAQKKAQANTPSLADSTTTVEQDPAVAGISISATKPKR